MALIKTSLVTGPTVEPLSLPEVKGHLRVEIGETAEDPLLNSLIVASRRRVEAITNRKLIEQTWKAYYDAWSTGDAIVLPYAPLSTGTAPTIKYTDSTGTQNTFSATGWRSDSVTEPPRLVLEFDQDWPTATLDNMNPIEVQYVCGYGDASSDIPEDIRVAQKMIISHLYENRENYLVGRIISPIPETANALLASHRLWTL